MDQYLHIGPHLHKFVNFDFSDKYTVEIFSRFTNPSHDVDDGIPSDSQAAGHWHSSMRM